MNKVRQFIGWIIAGVILAAAAGVFAGMALPLYGDISDKATEIENMSADLQNDIRIKAMPKSTDIQGFEAARGTLENKLNGVKKFYRDYDAPLEQWFPSLNLDAAGTPGTSQFRTEWLTHRRALDQKMTDWRKKGLGYHRPYADEDFKIDMGFNWEKIEELTANELDDARMRLFMKRYWIRKLIADIVTDPGIDAHRLLEVDFLKKVEKFDVLASAAGAVPSGEMIQHVTWDLGWLPGGQGAPGRQQSTFDNEQVLQADLGETITFAFAVTLPYKNVPDLLDRLMRVEQGKPLIHVVTTRIYVHDQNPFEWTETVDPGKGTDRTKELNELYGSRHPIVTITAYAIDFK